MGKNNNKPEVDNVGSAEPEGLPSNTDNVSESTQKELFDFILNQLRVSPRRKDRAKYKMLTSKVRFESNEIKESFPNSQWVKGIIERRKHYIENTKK